MREWLKRNYGWLMLIFVASVALFVWTAFREEEVIKDEIERMIAPVEMDVWRDENTGTVCYILNHNKPNQDMDCEQENYRD